MYIETFNVAICFLIHSLKKTHALNKKLLERCLDIPTIFLHITHLLTLVRNDVHLTFKD